MGTTMDMSSSEIAQDLMATEYGDEIMSAGWNPAVELVGKLLLGPAQGDKPGNPAKFATARFATTK